LVFREPNKFDFHEGDWKFLTLFLEVFSEPCFSFNALRPIGCLFSLEQDACLVFALFYFVAEGISSFFLYRFFF